MPRKNKAKYRVKLFWTKPEIDPDIARPIIPINIIFLFPNLLIRKPVWIEKKASPNPCAPTARPIMKAVPPIISTLAGIVGASIPMQNDVKNAGIYTVIIILRSLKSIYLSKLIYDGSVILSALSMATNSSWLYSVSLFATSKIVSPVSDAMWAIFAALS